MSLTILYVILGIIVAIILLSGIRFIPNNRIGIVEKRFGVHSVKGGFIALHGEAGYQPDVLRGGIHYLIPVRRPYRPAGDHCPGKDWLHFCP
jgi:uncharacterized membrane protein YqiK